MQVTPEEPLRIACVGECMIELSDIDADDGRARFGVAGDTLNTAVYLARLLPTGTARVSYLTALGPDRLSDRMLTFMTDEGVDTSHIARLEDRLPGIYAIELDANGERSFRYWREQAAARSMFRPGALQVSVLDEYDVVYLSGITLAILPSDDRAALLGKLAELKAAGRQVAFDSNYRPKLWPDAETALAVMDAAWRVATIALPSLDDESLLRGAASANDVLEAIAAAGVPEIALKRAAEGPILSVQGTQHKHTYPPASRIRDTTAAGDSFNAGYLAARLTGSNPQEAAEAGHRLACHVIGHLGAVVDMPSPANP